MRRKYKFGDKTRAYFMSFATVYWIDVFTREEYATIAQICNLCPQSTFFNI